MMDASLRKPFAFSGRSHRCSSTCIPWLSLCSRTVKEYVFDRAHCIVTEVAGGVVQLANAVHVGGDGGVATASETG